MIDHVRQTYREPIRYLVDWLNSKEYSIDFISYDGIIAIRNEQRSYLSVYYPNENEDTFEWSIRASNFPNRVYSPYFSLADPELFDKIENFLNLN